MDIRKNVEQLVEKIKKNPKLLEEFRKNPVKVIEGIVGMDLPDKEINELAKLVMAKIDMDKVGDLLGGLGSLLKK